MIFFHLSKEGQAIRATRLCYRAPGAEATSTWRIDRAGHVSFQNYPLAIRGRRTVPNWNAGQQCLAIWVERIGVKFILIRLLHDLAKVHDRHPVADVPYHAQVMGDEQVGQTKLVL